MVKKTEKAESFDLTKALEDCPKPDWYKRAFIRTMDISKIKSESDLVKLMKKYGEMK